MPKVTGKKSSQVPTVSPSVRLAAGVGPPEAFAAGLRPPTVRLAHKVNHQGDRTLEEGPPTVRITAPNKGPKCSEYQGQKTLQDPELLPALLVSYVYLEPFLKNRHRYHYRDWVMDSGAFSAHNSGTEIKLQDYINCCKGLMATDPKMVEVYALDVIGDWKASVKNAEEMWRRGVWAIPTFHYGSPWHVLKSLCRDYPKVAIGGCVGKRDKDKFAAQCFARAWPKKIHGFGFGSERSIMSLPFHSVDATNWEMGPCKYGRWCSFGNAAISVRGSQQNLRSEVEWYLELERKAREKWKKQMAELEASGPTVLLCGAADDVTDRRKVAFGNLGAPAVRLSADASSGSGERCLGSFAKRRRK